MCYVEQNLRERRVVFDDQRDAVAVFEVVAVVGDFDDLALIAFVGSGDEGARGWKPWPGVKEAALRILDFRFAATDFAPSLPSRLLIPRSLSDSGQVESKDAAFAPRARQADFAAQPSGDLAADREAEPRAAVLAAGRAIDLLERLEDDSLLFRGYSDAGVGHGESDHLVGLPERLAGVSTVWFGHHDVERDAPHLRELDGVRKQVPENLLQP